MVAAFAGVEPILNAYQFAVANKYRFYSYGDAMPDCMRNYCIITAAGSKHPLAGRRAQTVSADRAEADVGLDDREICGIFNHRRHPFGGRREHLAYAKEAIVDRYHLPKVTKIVAGGKNAFLTRFSAGCARSGDGESRLYS